MAAVEEDEVEAEEEVVDDFDELFLGDLALRNGIPSCPCLLDPVANTSPLLVRINV